MGIHGLTRRSRKKRIKKIDFKSVWFHHVFLSLFMISENINVALISSQFKMLMICVGAESKALACVFNCPEQLNR